MRDEIRELEKIARLLEPDAISREQLLHRIIDYTQKYLETVPHADAYTTDPDNGRALLESHIAEDGITIEEVLDLLGKNVDSLGVNLTSGRHLGYIPGGGLFHAALGDYLAAITNRYAGMFSISPGAVRIENMLLRWMASEIGYPETSAGNLTSGGSMATLTAIVAARDASALSQKEISDTVYYVTEHTHHCVRRALHIAGFDWRKQEREVRMDANYRMDTQALEEMIVDDLDAGKKPWLVVASAGTIHTGAVDPLSEIGAITSRHGLWFHVDGAYGGLFALCPEGKAALRGIDQSDSVVLDPHKTLFLPYGTGAVLLRARQKLYATFKVEGVAYLENLKHIEDERDELSPRDLSIELTRHFRGLRLWLPIKLLGVAPFRAALSEKIWLARYFYERIKSIRGFEVGPSPDLSIVSYRYLPQRGDPDKFNERLEEALKKDGRIFITSTKIDGARFLRAAILSYRTHLDEILQTLYVLEQKVRQLEKE